MQNSSASASTASPQTLVDKWRETAGTTFARLHPPYEINAAKSSKLLSTDSLATQQWIYAAMQRQTGQDRICAITYLINAHPLHCLHFLDSLISLITPAKQRDCICAIGQKHSSLMLAVVEEVRSFLFRPNLLERSKYYAIVLLSSIQLPTSKSNHENSRPASEIAVVLVKVYTAFFRAAVKATEVPERLIAALLAGLSRAAPFVPDSFTDLVGEVNDLFTLVHKTSFNVALQALSVLYQLSVHRMDLRDRYYQALYRKLLDPGVEHTSRAASLLHLVYRSMQSDTDQDRLAAFTHRLLQVCLGHSQPGFTVGCLILLSKVNTLKNGSLLFSPNTGQSELCNSTKGGAAQLAPLKANLQINFSTSADLDNNDAEDEEEHFSDAPDSDCSEGALECQKPVVASWYHRVLSQNTAGKSTQRGLGYQGEARDPRFARAHGLPVWPLVLLGQHSHPSVAVLANRLRSGQTVVYTGNPFSDFSLTHFLDRFAFKKPKPGKQNTANSSKATKPPPGRLLQPKKTGAAVPAHRSLPVNSAVFRQLAEHNVPADEQFFHSYFKFLETRGENKAGKQKKRQRDEDDSASDSSVSDNEFDTYLEKHEKGLIPSDEELDLDDDIHLNPGDLTASDNEHSDAGFTGEEEVEDIFSAMDGIGSQTFATSNGEMSECSDEDADVDDGDVSSDPDGGTVTRKRSNLESLFASADEVNHLYDVQETRKQQRQRVWEEQRSNLTGGRSRRDGRPSLQKRPSKRLKRI